MCTEYQEEIYAGLFTCDRQYGRLFITPHIDHLNAHVVNVYLLPDTRKINKPLSKIDGVIEVYGITGFNQNFYRYEYGWIHHGPWEEDFKEAVKIEREYKERRMKELARELEEHDNKIKKLLSNYTKYFK